MQLGNGTPPVDFVGNAAAGVWTIKKKTADETHDATAGNVRRDSALSFSVSANKTYQIRGRLISTQTRDDIGANHTMETPTLSFAYGDFRLTRTHQDDGSVVSTDLNSTRSKVGAATFYDGSDGNVLNFTAGASAVRAVYNRVDVTVVFKVTASGTVYFRFWAQAAAGPVTMLAGSYLEIAEIASS